MSRRRAGVVIAVLAVIAVALAVVLGYQLTSGDDRATEPASEAATTSASAEPTESRVEDPAAVLEAAGLDVVETSPAPEAPESWGDYELVRDWGGQVRLSRDGEAQSAEGPDGGRFPASMNGCGELMYFVPFRATGDPDKPDDLELVDVPVDARLIDAVGDVKDSARTAEGWTLGTNCSTPGFSFDPAGDESGPVDVDYTVYEYRRTPSEQSSTAAAAPVDPSTSAGPTFVECLFGTPGPARFSDGSIRNHQPCAETPQALRSRKAESVCGGLYGWQGVSKAEYLDLCGGPWPGGAPSAVPTPAQPLPPPEPSSRSPQPSAPVQRPVPDTEDQSSVTDAPR